MKYNRELLVADLRDELEKITSITVRPSLLKKANLPEILDAAWRHYRNDDRTL